MANGHEHFELQLDEAMTERGYHPDTQKAVWHLIGHSTVSCQAVLDMFSIIDEDPARHADDPSSPGVVAYQSDMGSTVVANQ